MAEGHLVGGNLSVLTRLLGTPYLPSLDGAVLLLDLHAAPPSEDPTAAIEARVTEAYLPFEVPAGTKAIEVRLPDKGIGGAWPIVFKKR